MRHRPARGRRDRRPRPGRRVLHRPGRGRRPTLRPVPDRPPRRHSAVVWWVVALHTAFGLAYTLLTPQYRGPDEARHVDMVRQYRAELGSKDPTEASPLPAAIGRSSGIVAPFAVPRPPQRAEDAPDRGDRVPFADLAPPGEQAGASRNQLTSHPPLAYVATGAASTVAGGLVPADVWSWDREVELYRLLDVLVVAPLPLLASAAALAVGLSRAAGAVAASFTLLVPMSTWIGSVVTNDALVPVLAGAAVVAALRHAAGDGERRWAWWAAAAAAGAALTKATGALLLPWTAVVVALGTARVWRAGRRRAAVVTGTVALALLAAGSSWYVTNLVRFGDPQPSDVQPAPAAEGFEADVGDFLPLWADRVTSTFWGQPARRTGVTLAWPVIHGLTALTLVAVGVALASRRRERWVAAALVALVAVQVALLHRSNWKAHARYGGEHALQGRYLYALLVPLATLAALAAWRLLRDRPAWLSRLAVALAAAGAAVHVALGRSMLDGYWAGPSRLAAVAAWSPFPVGVTAALLALPLAVAAAAVAAAVVAVRAGRQAPVGAAQVSRTPPLDTALGERVATTRSSRS